jgi:hypothetical protein
LRDLRRVARRVVVVVFLFDTSDAGQFLVDP